MAAGDTNITVIGNMVADPELRFTPSGAAVASFRIASTPRFFDKQANEWRDGDSLFLTCNVWRQSSDTASTASGAITSTTSRKSGRRRRRSRCCS